MAAIYHRPGGPNSMSHLENNMCTKNQRMRLQAESEADPVERLRQLCLSQGLTGILALGRWFRHMDDNGKKQLSEKEFLAGIRKTGMDITHEEAVIMFNRFNHGNHGRINIEEFLAAVRPPMSSTRRMIMEEAFNKIDKTGDGVVTLDDLKKVFSVQRHPLYITGEESEETIRKRFMIHFEEDATKDGHVTHEEFLNFYSALSATIDEDSYFDLVMRQCYKL